MKKGIISLAIVLAMVVSMFVPAFAEEAAVVEPIIKDFTGTAAFGDPIMSGGSWTTVVGTSYKTENGYTAEAGPDAEGGIFAAVNSSDVDPTVYKYGVVVYKTDLILAEGATEFDGAATFRIFTHGAAGVADFGLSQDGFSKAVFSTEKMINAYYGVAHSQEIDFHLNFGTNAVAEGSSFTVSYIAFFATEEEANAFDMDEYKAMKEAMKEQLKAEAAADVYMADFMGYSSNRYTNAIVMNHCGNQAGWAGLNCGDSYWNREGYWHVEITEEKDISGADVVAMMTEITGCGVPKDGGYTKAVILYRSNTAFTVYEGGLASNLGGMPSTNDEWATAVLAVPAGDNIQSTAGSTPYNYDKMILVSGSGAVGTYIDVAAVAFFTDADYVEVCDEEFIVDYILNNPYEYDNNYYFDNNSENANVWFKEYQMWQPVGDNVSLDFYYDLLELGMFRCTTHGLDCLMNEEFFEYWDGELTTDPVIKVQVTKNAKYAKVEAFYDYNNECVRFKVTPVDNFVAKDIDIEVQMYVIRNVANQAHKSNTVKFTLSLTNRYINDKDINAIAGEDCALFIDETAYVVKGSQFEEAGDKSVSIAWWNGTDTPDFVVDFASVVGQKGINFRWFSVGEAPAAVKDLSTTAKWAGITFGSEEAVVNGATVKVLNTFGEDYKYAYHLHADGTWTYLGEYAADAEYVEFTVAAGEALGTMLVSTEKFEPVVEPEPEPEPEQPSEPEQDKEEDKEAPGTGAGANMMSLAVIAVVALAGAAVVASKK